MIVRFAPRMASSMAGKIWSPFNKPTTRLPETSGGPRRCEMHRAKVGSPTAIGPMRYSIFRWPVKKFLRRVESRRVARTVARIVNSVVMAGTSRTGWGMIVVPVRDGASDFMSPLNGPK